MVDVMNDTMCGLPLLFVLLLFFAILFSSLAWAEKGDPGKRRVFWIFSIVAYIFAFGILFRLLIWGKWEEFNDWWPPWEGIIALLRY